MKFSPRDLNSGPYLTPHKHLYLWSNHCTKGAQCYHLTLLILLRLKISVSIVVINTEWVLLHYEAKISQIHRLGIIGQRSLWNILIPTQQTRRSYLFCWLLSPNFVWLKQVECCEIHGLHVNQTTWWLVIKPQVLWFRSPAQYSASWI